jgi:hypothetical protein
MLKNLGVLDHCMLILNRKMSLTFVHKIYLIKMSKNRKYSTYIEALLVLEIHCILTKCYHYSELK